MDMGEQEMNNIHTLNKEFARNSRIVLLCETAKRIHRCALLFLKANSSGNHLSDNKIELLPALLPFCTKDAYASH